MSLVMRADVNSLNFHRAEEIKADWSTHFIPCMDKKWLLYSIPFTNFRSHPSTFLFLMSTVQTSARSHNHNSR